MTSCFLKNGAGRLAALVMLGHLCTMRQAYAVNLDDYIAAGYAVVQITTLPVRFMRCRRNEIVTLADGSRLLCGRTTRATGLARKVYFLQRGSGPPSVLLIGGIPCSALLLQFGAHAYAVPKSLDSDPPSRPDDPTSRPAGPDDPFATGLPPLGPVRSINQIESGLNRPLNDAQPPPLPHAPSASPATLSH